MNCEIRIHGFGGQGIVSIAHLLGLAVTRSGGWAQSFAFFGTAQRGGTVKAFARVSDHPVRCRSFVYTPDILVVCADGLLTDPETLAGFEAGKSLLVNATSPISLQDPTSAERYWLDASQIARRELGRDIISTTMTGALLGLLPWIPFEWLEQAIHEMFDGKAVVANVQAARRGFERVCEQRREP